MPVIKPADLIEAVAPPPHSINHYHPVHYNPHPAPPPHRRESPHPR